MSFINQQSAPFVPASENVSLAGNIAFVGSISPVSFQNTQSVELDGEINLAGTILPYASGENAFFGTINLSGTIDFAVLTHSRQIELAGAINLSGELAPQITIPLNMPAPILKELSENAFSGSQSVTARLLKNGVELPIKGFTVSKPKGSTGMTVNIDLATKVLSAAEKGAVYTFQIGKSANPYDIPEWFTILSNARLSDRNYQMAWLNDSLSFGIAAPLSDKLSKYPKKNLIVYDSAKIEVSTEEIEKRFDTNGNEIETIERNISALSLYDLLQIAFVEGCGFSSFVTNIPNYEVSRCDFVLTNSWFNAVKGFIGVFEPLIFAVGNVLWLVDKTQGIPDEFSPVAISPDKFLSWRQSKAADTPLDALLLQFVESKKYATNYTLRTDTETVTVGDDIFALGYSEIEIEREFREYRSGFNPDLILRSEQSSETRTVKERTISGLETIRQDVTNFTYDSRSRITKIDKSEAAPLWSYFEGNWSKSVSPQTLRTEKHRFKYGSDPKNPRRQIQTGSSVEIKSILVTDAANPFLGNNFNQQYIDSVRSGNLNENQAVSFSLEPVKTVVEKLKPEAGQTRIERVEIDHLINEVTISSSDVRNGDNSQSNFESKQTEVYVFQPGMTPTSRAGNPIEPFSVGEIPLEFAQGLAERILERRTIGKESGSIELLGFSEELERGVYFSVLDRNADSLGVFVCEGFTVTGTNLGSSNQRIATAIDISEV